MKELVYALMMCLLLCPYVASAEGSYDDHSSAIEINLGSGNGSIIVVGDTNTIYLPPVQETAMCEPNTAAILPNGSVVLLLQETSLKDTRGFVMKFKRIALEIDNAGVVSVLWAE